MNLLKNFGSQILDFLETIILAFIIFLLIDNFVMQPHIVRGNSMLPNFHDGERIFTEKISYRSRPPRRGDIVVFRFPLSPEREYIKRVVGLPGEEIEISDGRVKIYNEGHKDGFWLAEDYLSANTETAAKSAILEALPFKIPENAYIVMGDNRPESSDSREWGVVPKENIVGRVFLRYWPPPSFAFILTPEDKNSQ